jgi:hypothetical protein
VGELYLDSRLDFLRNSQNADGGWGYFPGKQSWLEPTTYAMLALQGTPGSDSSLDRGWSFVRSLQTPDGSFQPNGMVHEGTWVTAHAVTLACVRGVYDQRVRDSVGWMLRVVGKEHKFAGRLASYMGLIKANLNVDHAGWPWRDGNSAWIEPTAHTLVALKKIATKYRSSELDHREGEALIFSRRCSDGGWNCGNPGVLNLDLPSYPETTALALIGLEGRPAVELTHPFGIARGLRSATKSSLAKAWLAIAMRLYDERLEAPNEPAKPRDVMLAALEALGHPAGNYRLLKPGART